MLRFDDIHVALMYGERVDQDDTPETEHDSPELALHNEAWLFDVYASWGGMGETQQAGTFPWKRSFHGAAVVLHDKHAKALIHGGQRCYPNLFSPEARHMLEVKRNKEEHGDAPPAKAMCRVFKDTWLLSVHDMKWLPVVTQAQLQRTQHTLTVFEDHAFVFGGKETFAGLSTNEVHILPLSA